MVKSTNEISIEESIKEFFLRKIRSPFVIVGLILVILFVLISIVPQIFTPYTLLEAFQSQPGAWNPPSPTHPLGQSELGYDVAAGIIYSIPTSLGLGGIAVIIGLGGGILFGYLAGRFNWKIYTIIMAGMIFFYILPAIVIVIIVNETTYDPTSSRVVLTIGALLIPSFTRVIANHVSRKLEPTYLFKNVVCYIPLHFGISIIIFESLGYLGFINPSFPTLGNFINFARTNLYSAPWASLFPGITIFGMALSFFLLYIGLQDYGQYSSTFKLKFGRSNNTSESLEDLEE
jgi:ABC-type dipeptide/oligopeptide/nickel transport system permease subunit